MVYQVIDQDYFYTLLLSCGEEDPEVIPVGEECAEPVLPGDVMIVGCRDPNTDDERRTDSEFRVLVQDFEQLVVEQGAENAEGRGEQQKPARPGFICRSHGGQEAPDGSGEEQSNGTGGGGAAAGSSRVS
jgi:hypothetical protein